MENTQIFQNKQNPKFSSSYYYTTVLLNSSEKPVLVFNIFCPRIKGLNSSWSQCALYVVF